MDDDSACCYPRCGSESVGLYGLRLCYPHLFKTILAADRLADDPEQVTEPVEQLRKLTVKADWRRRRAEALEPMLPPPPDERHGWVYFITFADRIKIGYTGNLAVRLENVPHDDVLAVIPGTLQDEKWLHSRFWHLRIHREWFAASPEILDYIAALPSECRQVDLDWHYERKRRRSGPVTVTQVAAS